MALSSINVEKMAEIARLTERLDQLQELSAPVLTNISVENTQLMSDALNNFI
jgi:hypothetical protein